MRENLLVEPTTGIRFTNDFPFKTGMNMLCSYETIPGDQIATKFFHIPLLSSYHIICRWFVIITLLKYLNLVSIMIKNS